MRLSADYWLLILHLHGPWLRQAVAAQLGADESDTEHAADVRLLRRAMHGGRLLRVLVRKRRSSIPMCMGGISAVIPVQRQSVSAPADQSFYLCCVPSEHPTEIEAQELEPRATHG